MLVIALALVLLAAACAVVLTEASRSVIPPMAPVVRAALPVTSTVTVTVTDTVPMQRMPGQIGSAKADAASRTYAFIAELPAEPQTAIDKTL